MWCDAIQFGRNLPSCRETFWIHLIIDREEVNGPLRNVYKFVPGYTVSHPRRRVKCVVARDAELSPCILKCVDVGTGVNTVNTTCVFVSNDKTPPIALLMTDIKPVRFEVEGKKFHRVG